VCQNSSISLPSSSPFFFRTQLEFTMERLAEGREGGGKRKKSGKRGGEGKRKQGPCCPPLPHFLLTPQPRHPRRKEGKGKKKKGGGILLFSLTYSHMVSYYLSVKEKGKNWERKEAVRYPQFQSSLIASSCWKGGGGKEKEKELMGKGVPCQLSFSMYVL